MYIWNCKVNIKRAMYEPKEPKIPSLKTIQFPQTVYKHSLHKLVHFTCNHWALLHFPHMSLALSLPQFPGRQSQIQIMWFWRWGAFFPTAKPHDVPFDRANLHFCPNDFFYLLDTKAPERSGVYGFPSLTLTRPDSIVAPLSIAWSLKSGSE